MTRLIEYRKEFLKFSGLYEKPHIELKDYGAIKGKISKKNRLLFTEMLREEKQRGYLIGFMGYNGSGIIRWSFELGKKLYAPDYPLFLFKNYDRAIKKSLEIFHKGSAGNPATENQTKNDEIEKLLYFISELSWNLEDKKIPDFDLPDDNPYKKLYQALALIKTDYTDIIEKQRKAENALQNSYNEIEKKVEERTILLREERAKLETSLDILSHDTKNHFISLKYDTDQIEDIKLKTSINESVTEIQELIMEATGIMSSKKRILSIVEVMENIKLTAKRIALMTHDRIEVEFIDPEFLFIQTSALFKNALANLIENALKYTGGENKIKISVEKKQNINIHIIDYGKGIPDIEKKKILEKFYRRQEAETVEGSGRGLWITNNIIRQEGGTLTISDNPDGGAVFTISMPPYIVENFETMLLELSNWFEMPLERIKTKAETYRTLYQLQEREDMKDMDSAVFTTILTEIRKERKEEKHAFISMRLENLKERNRDGKSIIIVDDSLYVQYYLAKYFTELGFNILDYQDNGESAVISYRNRRPDYISLDNNMNVKTGPEAAEEIYRIDENAKIIFITALGDSTVFQDGLRERLPGKEYKILTKPIYKRDVENLMEQF